MQTPMFWNSVIATFVLTAAVADVRWRKIPRWLTLVALVTGLAVHWVRGDFWSAATAALLGFAIGLSLFSLGAIGGGDVKLITALGALLGFGPWAFAMQVTILAAAAMAIFQIIRHKVVVQTFRNVGAIFKGWSTSGFKAHPVINVHNASMVRSPFAVAAALGTLYALFR
jgi:prepilin peptidase CpaA